MATRMSDGNLPLRALDLNLLVHLDALLAERSVTRAAERLFLSQPTVSGSLRRLRQHFGDSLLVRNGNQYELTPLAARLRPVLETTLNGAGRVFTSAQGFDPGDARREFSLLATDFWAATIGSRLLRLVTRQAPHVSIQFGPLTPTMIDQAAEVLRVWDGAIAPTGVLGGLSHEPLHRSRWVCVVDADNEQVGGELTVEDLASLPWVVVAIGSANSPTARTSSVATEQLALYGIRPSVAMTTASFLAVPGLVAGTDCVAFVQEELAEGTSERLGLRILEPPIPIPDLDVAFWWHPLHESDLGHAWLRARIADAIALEEQCRVIG
jgi:DNA-binding transcriptional LysR family regulator